MASVALNQYATLPKSHTYGTQGIRDLSESLRACGGLSALAHAGQLAGSERDHEAVLAAALIQAVRLGGLLKGDLPVRVLGDLKSLQKTARTAAENVASSLTQFHSYSGRLLPRWQGAWKGVENAVATHFAGDEKNLPLVSGIVAGVKQAGERAHARETQEAASRSGLLGAIQATAQPRQDLCLGGINR
ncbi:MAG: hypothetical protein PW734_02700 [Verrucomicrobium sp.]|nr:hypothetical protein [Verrucomicrobium sp.]